LSEFLVFLPALTADLGTFPPPATYQSEEDAMKAFFQNLPTKTWLLLVIPTVVVAYPIVRIVVPAVVHAVVPEVVRNVLQVI
jgi:hypothetical protein